jgi:hypothetical protein
MLEINEFEAARALLRQGTPLKQLKEGHLEKYLKLENLLSQTVLNGEIPFNLKETKKSRRDRIINSNKKKCSFDLLISLIGFSDIRSCQICP